MLRVSAALPLRGTSIAATAVRLSRSYGTRPPLDVLAQHFSPAVPRAPKGNDIVVDHAKGTWVTEVSGRRYLDFQTGIGVTSTGHCE